MTSEFKTGILINHLRNRTDTHEFLVEMSKVENIILLIEKEDKFVAETLGIAYYILKPLNKSKSLISQFLFLFQKQKEPLRNERLNAKLKTIKSTNLLEYRFKRFFLASSIDKQFLRVSLLMTINKGLSICFNKNSNLK